ncbi:type I restriction enzyme HsdR N-terminal domain-containing protein, partial [Pelobium sp.]
MFKPVPLNLPPYPFKLTIQEDVTYIFDELRKKKLVLTPEEWVRQHFIQFLIQQKRYPKSLIKLEGGLKLNQLQKRTDILIFNKEGKADILVECKATFVK